jgi:hypothetical protein
MNYSITVPQTSTRKRQTDNLNLPDLVKICGEIFLLTMEGRRGEMFSVPHRGIPGSGEYPKPGG